MGKTQAKRQVEAIRAKPKARTTPKAKRHTHECQTQMNSKDYKCLQIFCLELKPKRRQTENSQIHCG